MTLDRSEFIVLFPNIHPFLLPLPKFMPCIITFLYTQPGSHVMTIGSSFLLRAACLQPHCK